VKVIVDHSHRLLLHKDKLELLHLGGKVHIVRFRWLERAATRLPWVRENVHLYVEHVRCDTQDLVTGLQTVYAHNLIHYDGRLSRVLNERVQCFRVLLVIVDLKVLDFGCYVVMVTLFVVSQG
jgi:hypothetical protein